MCHFQLWSLQDRSGGGPSNYRRNRYAHYCEFERTFSSPSLLISITKVGQQIDLQVDEIVDTPITVSLNTILALLLAHPSIPTTKVGQQIDLQVDEIIDTPITVSLNTLLALLHCSSPSIPTTYVRHQIDLRAEKLIDMPITVSLNAFVALLHCSSLPLRLGSR